VSRAGLRGVGWRASKSWALRPRGRRRGWRRGRLGVLKGRLWTGFVVEFGAGAGLLVLLLVGSLLRLFSSVDSKTARVRLLGL
jgi:hypothetical protein